MKYLITFLISIIGFSPAFSQEEETGIPFVSYWSIGDSYKFQVSKIKQKWKAGEQVKNDTNSYFATFTVLDSTETSYQISWKYSSDLLQYLDTIPEEYVERFSKYENMEVIYTTSEVGEFVGIDNWEELSETMGNLFTDVIEVLTKDKSQDKESLTTALSPFFSIYQSKEGMENVVFKELQLFHYPFGIEYFEGDTIKYEELLPNMLGGDPIKGETKLYVTDVVYDEAYCAITQEMSLNPEDTRDLILSFFKRMGIKDEDLNEMMKTAKIEIKDFNNFEYYYYPGVPIYIETRRETNVDIAGQKGKGIDIIILELL